MTDDTPAQFLSARASTRYVIALVGAVGGLSHVNTSRLSDRLSVLEASQQQRELQTQTLLGRRDREADQSALAIRRELDALDRRLSAMEQR